MTITLRQLAEQARSASRQLANLSTERKNEVLLAFARKIRENTELILSANQKDLGSADRLRSQGELSDSSIQRLKLNGVKIEQMAKNFENVAALTDQVGQVQLATRLDEGLDLHRISCPIGVLLVIFESRPEVVVQISALTLKSGNAVILKGGKEASESNACLFGILDQVLKEFTDLPDGTVNLLQSREAVSEIVQQNDCLDLIIPRGSNALVQHIQQHSRVPVLAHADGICHVYWDQAASLSKAMEIIIDAKTEYPAVCNAMETLLIHEQIPENEIKQLLTNILEAGVEIRACSAIMKKFSNKLNGIIHASEQDWKTEYTDLILSVRLVSSHEEAIGHINPPDGLYDAQRGCAKRTREMRSQRRGFANALEGLRDNAYKRNRGEPSASSQRPDPHRLRAARLGESDPERPARSRRSRPKSAPRAPNADDAHARS